MERMTWASQNAAALIDHQNLTEQENFWTDYLSL